MSQRDILCHDRVLARLEDFLSRLSILCCNRVGQGKEKLCRDRIVYAATKCYYVTKEFSNMGRIYVATEYSYVATENLRI